MIGRFRAGGLPAARLWAGLLALQLVAAAAGAWAGTPDPRTPPPTARFVLQIGIEHYRWVPRLPGPVADVRDLREVLVRHYGFRSEDFRTLADSQATRAGILSAIREQLVENARLHPGALCVLQYSGHGSRAADLDHEPWEPDGYDETLVPWDGRDPEGLIPDVVDDELADLLAELRRYTTRVVLIFDACHAGTLTRGLATGRVQNGLPPSRATVHPHGGRADEDSMGVALFAAPPGQRSWVEDIGGEFRSVFSYQLARVLETASSRTTYAQVLARVGGAIRARYQAQVPLGEGPLDQPVFGGSARDDGADLAVRIEGRGLLRVEAGLLQGITLGAVLAVRAPHAGSARDDSVLVEGPVVQVAPSDCRLRVDESIVLPDGARAFMRRPGVGYEPVRFAWEAPDSVAEFARARLRDRLKGDPLLELVDATSGGGAAPTLGVIAATVLAPGDARSARARRPPGLAIVLDGGVVALDRVFPAASEAGVDSLETALRRVALAENVRRLGTMGPSLADGIDFSLVVERRRTRSGAASDTLHPGGSPTSVEVGDRVRAVITNRTGRRVCVAVLHVGPDRVCDVLEPEGAVSVSVEAGSTFVAPDWWRVEPPLGVDHLKLVVTDHPVDLSAVSEPVRTRGPDTGFGGSLGRVLWAAGAQPTRGAAGPVAWAVLDLPLLIAPSPDP